MIFKLIECKFDYLCELAYDRQTVLHNLENSIDYIVEHLIQLFVFDDTQNFNHWCSEVYRGCHKIPKLSGSKHRLKKETILNRLWYNWEDSYEDYISMYLSNVSYKENKEIPEYNEDNLYSFIQDYFIWLSDKLYTNGFITFEDCKNKILYLIDKYKG